VCTVSLHPPQIIAFTLLHIWNCDKFQKDVMFIIRFREDGGVVADDTCKPSISFFFLLLTLGT